MNIIATLSTSTGIAIGAVVILHFVASLFIAYRDDLEVWQKLLQILLIWLIPSLSAILFKSLDFK